MEIIIIISVILSLSLLCALLVVWSFESDRKKQLLSAYHKLRVGEMFPYHLCPGVALEVVDKSISVDGVPWVRYKFVGSTQPHPHELTLQEFLILINA